MGKRVSYSRAYPGKGLYGPGKRGHNVAETLVPTQMFPRLPARATSVATGNKYCVRDKKNVSDFVQKHFVSATNVSQFAQHGNTTFILCPARLRPDQISWATMGPQQRVRNHLSLCQGLYGFKEQGQRQRQQENNDLIGWMRKIYRAARASRTLVGTILWRCLPNDNVKFPNLRF